MEHVLVVVSGGFDPLHSGHISYLKAARSLGHDLIVGLNSDDWLTRKKGRAFMSWAERSAVIQELKCVNQVRKWDDSDDTAIGLLETIKSEFSNSTIIFANGGDRTATNIPELCVYGVQFVYGVGGYSKANSSSWILQEWTSPKTPRPWGYYRVLHEIDGTKVKELTIEPGQKLSMQRHSHRAEYWHVSSGQVVVNSSLDSGYNLPSVTLNQHDNYHVPVNQWHQLTNPFEVACKIVEIQYGTKCTESDIERK